MKGEPVSSPSAPSPAESLTRIEPQPAARGAEPQRRMVYLMLFRVVLISLVLGSTIVLSWLSDVDLTAPSSFILFALIATTYLLTIVYAVAIRRGKMDPQRLGDYQIAGDLLITAILVHVTGGAQSAFTFFFPLSIIGAATLRFRAGAIAVSLASIVLLATVSLLGWYGVIPAASGQRIVPSAQTALELGGSLGLNLSGIIAVGLLSMNLGSQLQRTSAKLETQRSATADLLTLHQDIVRSLSSGLITVDLDDHALTANQAACELLEIRSGSVLGTHIDELIPDMANKLSKLESRHSLSRLEAQRNDGLQTLGVSVSPLFNHRDEVVGRVVNFQDLTELRQMEEGMKRAERLAMIGGLAAGVAHEIRNPLASISGSVELLRSSPQTDDESRTLMDIVTREIERLNRLISDLLDYTNPRPSELGDVDLTGLVGETVRVFEQDRNFPELELKAELPENALRVQGDPEKLRQVLWNLLRNAAEAAADGGNAVTVSLTQNAKTISLAVADNGPGIPQTELPRIFDPFFTTKSKGSGLGLAVVHNIVADHGGSIAVDSERDQGACFRVELPIPALPA